MSFAVFGGDMTILVDDVVVPNRTGEWHSWSAQATNYAVEDGSAAADHIVELPDGIEIGWTVGNSNDDGGVPGTEAAAVMDSLHAAIKRRELYDVVTQHKLYTSMAFIDARIEHVSPYTGAISGRVAFSNVPQLTLERVSVPESRLSNDRAKSGSSEVNSGRVDGAEPTDAQKGSFLRQIFSKRAT